MDSDNFDNFEKRNNQILNWFTKFENHENYDSLRDKLDEISKYRVRQILKLGQFEIPDIGPDPKILDFHKSIEGWDEASKQEVKHSIKIYEGEIETLEEAIITLEILKRQHSEKRKTLETMVEDLKTQNFENMIKYIDILDIDVNHPNHILFNSLFFFFAKLLDDN
jgi:hypothetical protein